MRLNSCGTFKTEPAEEGFGYGLYFGRFGLFGVVAELVGSSGRSIEQFGGVEPALAEVHFELFGEGVEELPEEVLMGDGGARVLRQIDGDVLDARLCEVVGRDPRVSLAQLGPPRFAALRRCHRKCATPCRCLRPANDAHGHPSIAVLPRCALSLHQSPHRTMYQ